MKLFLDIVKAGGGIKPPKPPKAPKGAGAPEPAGADALNKTSVTAGSSEDYDYVSKQQYAEKPTVAVGETENSWIVPKGAAISSDKADKPEEGAGTAEEDQPAPAKKIEPDVASDPLVTEQQDISVDPETNEPMELVLDMEEGNTMPSKEKPKPGESKPQEKHADPRVQDELTNIKAEKQQQGSQKLADKKAQQIVKEEVAVDKQNKNQLNDDFDALVNDLDLADSDKKRRDDMIAKEQSVIKDTLKKEDTGFTPKEAKEVSTEATPVTPEKVATPAVARSKDKQGPYDTVKDGNAAKHKAVQEYAQANEEFKSKKQKFVDARAKHQEAVETYNKKKQNAEAKEKTFEENKEAHSKATEEIKSTIKKTKNAVKDQKDKIKELRNDPESSMKDIHKEERKLDKLEQSILKDQGRLDKLKSKEPKKPDKFKEKEPKFTEKEPEGPAMRAPANEVEHMQWQDHVRGADKLAQGIEDRLQDNKLSDSQRKRLEALHEQMSYHAGLHNFPTPQQTSDMKKMQKMLSDVEKELDEEKAGDKSKGKPLSLPSNIGQRLGRIGTTAEAAGDVPSVVADGVGGAARVAGDLLSGDGSKKDEEDDTSAAANNTEDSDNSAAQNPGNPSKIQDQQPTPQGKKYTQADFDAERASTPEGAGEALGTLQNPGKKEDPTRPRTPQELESKDRPNGESSKKRLKTPEELDGTGSRPRNKTIMFDPNDPSKGAKDSAGQDKKKPKLKTPEELDKSMPRLYLDLKKGIGQRPNTAVDSDKTKDQNSKDFDSSFEKRTAGASGGSMAPDKPSVGKQWKAVDEEDPALEEVKKKLDTTKKSLDNLFETYSTEKNFLKGMGYSDEDILYGRYELRPKDHEAYQEYLLSNLNKSLSNLKKAL